MPSGETHVVTGAFGFSGKYIAGRLIDAGHKVRTITNSVNRANPFNGNIRAFPYNFDHTDRLIESLHGASVLYNNYWVRFNHDNFSYSEAVDNTMKLFDAAKKAGIKRVVHISITNPSEASPFEYFSGKAKLESALIESGLSYSILRPAVIFGKEDILVNNIAWFLRKFPAFGVFGKGNYRLQPIYVEDLAELAVEQGQKSENLIIDAIGPETFTYRELVETISKCLGLYRRVISVPPLFGYFIGSVVGAMINDVTITLDEIEGLMADLLYTNSPPLGKTKLTEWVKENADSIGIQYKNELARRENRTKSYQEL